LVAECRDAFASRVWGQDEDAIVSLTPCHAAIVEEL